MGVPDAVQSAGLAGARADLAVQVEGLLAVGEGLLVPAGLGAVPAGRVEGRGLAGPVARGPVEIQGPLGVAAPWSAAASPSDPSGKPAGRPPGSNPTPSAAEIRSTDRRRGCPVRPCSRSRTTPTLTPAAVASCRWVSPAARRLSRTGPASRAVGRPSSAPGRLPSPRIPDHPPAVARLPQFITITVEHAHTRSNRGSAKSRRPEGGPGDDHGSRAWRGCQHAAPCAMMIA